MLVDGGNAMGIGLKQADKLSRGYAWRWVESRRVRSGRRSARCMLCTLRFSRLLPRFAPRFRSLALLGWISSAIALDQTPDRAIGDAAASPDLAQAPSSREQGPGLVGLRLGEARLLLLWQQFGRSAPEMLLSEPEGVVEIGEVTMGVGLHAHNLLRADVSPLSPRFQTVPHFKL